MNRDIKFRGICEDTKVFVYGDVSFSNYGTMITKFHFYEQEDEFGSEKKGRSIIHKVIQETLGQLTCLTDKNGKEIYEGDIVKERYYPFGAPAGIEYYKLGVIVWSGGGFGNCIKIDGLNVLKQEDKLSHHKERKDRYKHPTQGYDWIESRINPIRYEVIGNIHENPELLQDGN